MTGARGATSCRRTARATRLGVLPLLLAMLAGLLVGCSGDDAPSAIEQAAQQRAEVQQLLDQRALALRRGNLRLFLSSLDRSDVALVRRQRRYFHNVRQLRPEQFGYRVLERSWPDLLVDPHWGSGVLLPQVEVTLQLRGYDAVPVTRLTGFAFGRRDGRLLILSDRTRSGSFFPGVQPAPWEITRIRVRDSGTVLGIYDVRSYADSAMVNRAVVDGVRDVRSILPFRWSGRVVVYEFTDDQVLKSFDNVPGGNISHLGAMTFPVPARPGGSRTASSRFVVMHGSVAAGQPFLDRIVRHELTHVAIGERDDGVPTWFAEGVAEYVAAHDIAPDQRRIAAVAVDRARGRIEGMPASASFNGADQDWNYALAWMACDWIAAHRGESRLWDLMTALHDGGEGTADDQQDAVLRSVVGLDSDQLARRAAERILQIYG